MGTAAVVIQNTSQIITLMGRQSKRKGKESQRKINKAFERKSKD